MLLVNGMTSANQAACLHATNKELKVYKWTTSVAFYQEDNFSSTSNAIRLFFLAHVDPFTEQPSGNTTLTH